MKVEDKPLVNRVANSSLITINLEDWYPSREIKSFDLKEHLFHGLILKEKDFRAALKAHDWSQYDDGLLAVYCSTDAIVPVWAYMLVAAYAQPHAHHVHLGTPEDLVASHYRTTLATLDVAQYEGQRIVIKGCSNKPVPPSAYLELTRRLRPHAQSVMYGEPCSTVPIFKIPRKIQKK